jgi:hypothetical protein
MTGRSKTVAGTAIFGLLVLVFAVAPLAARETPKGRWLKIRVYENGSSTPNVLVNVPMGVVSAFLRIAARTETHASIDLPGEGGEKSRLRVQDLDLEEVIRELESMDPGQILEVQKDDERVSIWIE